MGSGTHLHAIGIFHKGAGRLEDQTICAEICLQRRQHDDLYWKAAEGEPESPLGLLAARASAEGYQANANPPQPFYGYFFRILIEQGGHAKDGARKYIIIDNVTGGFAFLACPAECRVTGVMSFLVNRGGVILQKDLRPETAESAKAMTAFDPDDSWAPVE